MAPMDTAGVPCLDVSESLLALERDEGLGAGSRDEDSGACCPEEALVPSVRAFLVIRMDLWSRRKAKFWAIHTSWFDS